MSKPVTNLRPPSPGNLLGSIEARPLPAGPSPPAEITSTLGCPGEAPSWSVLDYSGDALPVSPRQAEKAKPAVKTRAAGSASRTVRLMTLERDWTAPEPRTARRARPTPAAGHRSKSASHRDTSQSPGLQDWMAAILRDSSCLQLDTANTCMVLHAIWKNPDRREPMLNDARFRQKEFNAFIMDAVKSYQRSEQSNNGDVPMSETGKRKRRKVDVKDEVFEFEPVTADDVSLSPDPSDPLWEPTADDGDGESSDAADAADDDPDWRESSPDVWPKTTTPKTSKSKAVKSKSRRSKALNLRSVKSEAVSPVNSGSEPSTPLTEPTDATEESGLARGRVKKSLRRLASWHLVKDELASETLSEDLCARVNGPMMRTSGRRLWRNDAVLLLARKNEDASEVPDSSFLFIRCTRCPELAFVDYPAIRQHWDLKCHFLACIMCDMIFNTARLALAHLRVIHKDPVPEGWYRLVRCHPCNRSGFYSTEQVIGHMAGHRSERSRNPAVFPPFLTCYKRIRCNQCGLMIIHHRSELEDHYKRDPPPLCSHDATRPTPLTCPACRRIWAGPAALSAHVRHSGELCRKALQPLSVLPAAELSPNRGCPACSRRMDPGESLADHLMTHLAPGLRCVQCGLVVGSHQEMQAHRAFIWRCDCQACDTHVGRGSRLLQHIIEDHDGGRRLTETARARPKRAKEDAGVCKVCGRFTQRLQIHMKQSHSTRHCPCCDKDVKLVTYKNHMAKIRNREKWRCKVCFREMSSDWALQTHMRLHTGEKPYECELCPAAYVQKVMLKTHMKTAHGIVWPSGGVAAVRAPLAVAETEVSTSDVLF